VSTYCTLCAQAERRGQWLIRHDTWWIFITSSIEEVFQIIVVFFRHYSDGFFQLVYSWVWLIIRSFLLWNKNVFIYLRNAFIRLVPSCPSFHSIDIPFPFNLNQHSSLIYFSITRDSKDILFCFCSAYNKYTYALISLSHSVSPLFLSIYIQYLNSKTNKSNEWYLTKCKTPPPVLSSKIFALLIRYNIIHRLFSLVMLS